MGIQVEVLQSVIKYPLKYPTTSQLSNILTAHFIFQFNTGHMLISEKKLNLTLRQVFKLILLQNHVGYNIFYLDYHQDLQPTISNIYQLV